MAQLCPGLPLTVKPLNAAEVFAVAHSDSNLLERQSRRQKKFSSRLDPSSLQECQSETPIACLQRRARVLGVMCNAVARLATSMDWPRCSADPAAGLPHQRLCLRYP
jgi:hypothetical protein